MLKQFNPEKSKDRNLLDSHREKFIKSGPRSGGLCMGVHAPWGSGKTLTLTFIAVERNALEGIPIVANFELTKVNPFMFMNDVEIIKEMEYASLFLDEIRRYIDSYMSTGMKTRFISNLVADLGKQSCDFYFSDQHYNAAPPRVKVNLNMVAMPEYDEDSQWVTVYLFHSLDDFVYMNPFFYFGFYAPDYWDYYNTREKIEDYKLKFKAKRYANQFLKWALTEDWVRPKKTLTKDILNYWNETEGVELSRGELGAVYIYLKHSQKKGD